MKKFLFTSAFFFIFSSLQAQLVEVWNKIYDPADQISGNGTSVFKSPDGNLITAGNLQTAATFRDFTFIKYDTQGDTLWVSRVDNFDNNEDVLQKVTTDVAGNIYATGYARNDTSGVRDLLETVKIDNAGNVVWINIYADTSILSMRASDITFDEVTGNTYVLGSIRNGTTYDYILIAYDVNGNQRWSQQYGNPLLTEVPNALALSNTGKLYAAGPTAISSTDNDIVLLTYDTAGTAIDTFTYASVGNGFDNLYAVTTDALGNVYACGYISDSLVNTDKLAVLFKLDDSGNLLQTQFLNNSVGNDDRAYFLQVMSDQSVFVSGNSLIPGNADSRDAFIQHYDSAFNPINFVLYNSLYNKADFFQAVATDAIGNLYLTGYSVSDGIDSSVIFTVKFDQALTKLWLREFGNPLDRNRGLGISVFQEDEVYVTGYAGDGVSINQVTIKYNDVTGFAEVDGKGVQLYPNPAAELVQILLPADVKNPHYRFTNVYGALVSEGDLSGNDQIDLIEMKNGFYTMTIIDDLTIIAQKKLCITK